MRGNTATISLTAFRADWLTHLPMRDLCIRYTVSRDQIVRLKHVWQLPPRHDRRLRAKPVRHRDPTPAEIRRACAAIQATWNENTREDRRVTKTVHFKLQRVELTGEMLEAMGPAEWVDDAE